MLRKIWRKIAPNPLDARLKRAASKGGKKFLIPWNRGLGDIPLGLCALVHRIRTFIPDAKITFLTRPDLKPGFSLLENVDVIENPDWKRGTPTEPITLSGFDCILENPDPTYWVKWQLGKLIPKLKWNPEWDCLCEKFSLGQDCKYIGVHVQTETVYGYQKNWPPEFWLELFKKVKNDKIILFGFKPDPIFEMENVVDLRGKTELFAMLSIIKNKCSHLIVPDSGVLSLTYYLDVAFPLKILSLWADPNQGILKQNVPSPNPLLTHKPLFGSKITDISVEKVYTCLMTL